MIYEIQDRFKTYYLSLLLTFAEAGVDNNDLDQHEIHFSKLFVTRKNISFGDQIIHPMGYLMDILDLSGPI